MTEVPPGARPLPTTRTTPLDPPPELLERQRECPVDRLRYPDGSEGWLITGYDQVRAALADLRFSSRKELLRSPVQPQEPSAAKPGFFVYTDPPEHTKYRRLLTGLFTLRRMNQLAERVKEIADDALDAMERTGPPVDLVPAYALPLPSLVICELLGVPYEDREVFQHNSTVIQDINTPIEQAYAALEEMQNFLAGLVERRRARALRRHARRPRRPRGTHRRRGHQRLLPAPRRGPRRDHRQHALPGHLRPPRQPPTSSRCCAPATTTVEAAVEALMRRLTVNRCGPSRAVVDDLDFEGGPMKAGETVTPSAIAATP
ncbi:Cytochrome P450 OS=Streptomyces fumanus OX=67302 GN=GCM10018772_14640 PE=3 SV=1 [Streptomyces fumanus]